MFWLVLKPYPGLADEPSVRQPTRYLRVFVQVAVVSFALCCSPLTARPASPAANNNGPESAEIAAVGYFASPSPVREIGSPTLKITGSPPPEYTIRRTAPEVRLQFSVADERGRLITDLSADDIWILDDHFAVHRIREFSRAEDLPLQIGLLVDVSDSVRKTILLEKQATQLFLDRVMRPLSDRAFLVGFGRDIHLWQPSTGDTQVLNEGLQRLQQSGYATNLYDSVFYACLNQFRHADAGAQQQRIILLFSDGEDTASLHTIAEAIALAQRREIQIYALSIHSARKFAPGDAILRRLADETGGQHYIASGEKDFHSIFTEMERQIRTQYYVSFPPERQTPGFHDLRVETTSNRNLHIHARQGYYFDAPQ
jgi:VWFA-related protein